MSRLKKSIALGLLAIFCLVLTVGCTTDRSDQQPNPPAQNEPKDNEPDEQEQTDQEQDQEQEAPAGVKQGTGIYQGQIDNNSIEIKISGVPEDVAYRAFALTETAKASIEQLGIQEGDQVSFTYVEEERMQPQISEITKK